MQMSSQYALWQELIRRIVLLFDVMLVTACSM